jgi:hypothetical protein
MAFRIVTVYGNPSTWITFFGSYLGAVISGFITILGVYLTIRFTQKQNNINLEVTRKLNDETLEVTRNLNEETLEFTKKESRREKLPLMIHNLQECLDFIEEIKAELEIASRGSLEEILDVSIQDRDLKLHYINDNYHIAKKSNLIKFTRTYYKKIRNYAVTVNATAYDAVFKFSNDLKSAHISHIHDLEIDFIGFQKRMMNDYINTDAIVLISDEGKLTDIELMDEDKMQLKKMKRDLYIADSEYLRVIASIYDTLFETLEIELLNLIDEFNS